MWFNEYMKMNQKYKKHNHSIGYTRHVTRDTKKFLKKTNVRKLGHCVEALID
jgi:hypothetical protein